MSTDTKTGDIVLTEDARLEWENALLTADEIRYNPRTNIGAARGHVILTRGPRRILADELIYHLDTQTFTVKNARLGQYPLYLTATEITGSRDKIVAKNAIAFYSEPYFLAPSLKAGVLTYLPNQSVTAESARIGLGTTIPVAVPTYHQSLNGSTFTYSDATIGYRGTLGAHAGVGILAPVANSVWAGADLAVYTKRGALFGPAALYDTTVWGHEISGSFHSGYIHDYGQRGEDVLARSINKDRGYVEWTHHQDITNQLTVFGQIRYWEDSEVIRDFIPREFFEVQTPDSFFEGLYTGTNYTVSLFTRFDPNNYARVQQRLPEVRFDLLPTPIGLGIYERFNSSIAVLREDSVANTNSTTLTSNRLDAFYSIYRPISPKEWFTFTPVAGGRLTYYENAMDGRSEYTRVLGEVGFDANLQMSGVFNYKNERWNIDGIRHLLTPRVSYRYIPAAAKGQQYIPDIDRTVFSTYLQPLELGDQLNVDELRPTNTFRLELDNTFQTRDKQYGSRDLLIFNLAADLNVDRHTGQNRFSAVQSELAFMPAKWLQLNVYQSVDPKNFDVHELNSGIQVMDAKAWSVRLGNRYLAKQIQEYTLDGRYRLNEVYDLFARLDYDAHQTRFVERTVGVNQNLHNIWKIEYAVSFYSGRRRESNFGLTLRINLIGL